MSPTTKFEFQEDLVVKELLSEIPKCKIDEYKGEHEHSNEETCANLTEPNDSPFRVRRLSRSISIPTNLENERKGKQQQEKENCTGNEEVLLATNSDENQCENTTRNNLKSKFILLKRSRSLGNIFITEKEFESKSETKTKSESENESKTESKREVEELTEKVEALEIEVLSDEENLNEQGKEQEKEQQKTQIQQKEQKVASLNDQINENNQIIISKLIDRPQTSPPVFLTNKTKITNEEEPKMSILDKMQKSLGFFFRCARKDESSEDESGLKHKLTGNNQHKYPMRSRTPDAKFERRTIVNNNNNNNKKDSKEQKDVKVVVDDEKNQNVPMQAINFVTKVDKNGPVKSGEFVSKKLPQFFDISGPKGPLLQPQSVRNEGKKCLVLDLDETLVHSSFHVPESHDLVVTLGLPDGSQQNIYVAKRPGVDEFLAKASELFEVVIFTASLAHYADPVIDFLTVGMNRHLKEPLDINLRLYRESCLYLRGLYVKDLSRLGRPLEQTLIVDNSPASFLLQPDHGIPIKSWFSDTNDRELALLQDSLLHLVDAESIAEWKSIISSF